MKQKDKSGKKTNIPEGEDRGLYPEEVAAVIKAPHMFRKKTSKAIERADMHQLVLLLIWDTWARGNELCHIKIEHIDLDNRILTLHKTKAVVVGKADNKFVREGRPRMVSFSEEAGLLIERVKGTRKRGYLFKGQNDKRLSTRAVRHIVGNYAVLTGIQRITGYDKGGRPRYLVHAHALREAGEAYAILIGKMSKKTAAKKAGHSTEIQERYYTKYDIIRERMEADIARQELQAKFGSII